VWRARVTSGLAVLLAGCVLAGCWSQSEVNDVAMLTVVALDRTPEGQYRWSVVVPAPEEVTPPPLSGGGGSPSRAGGSLRTATGPSPVIAAEALETVIPREVRWSHADHILVGEETARSGLRRVLDFASRRYQIERRSHLYVTRGEASKVLDRFHPALERSLARSFDNISRRLRPGTVIPVDVNTFLRWLGTPGLDPHLPVVKPVTQPRGTVIPEPSGIALFRGDRLVGFVEPPADRGLLFLRGEMPPFTLQAPCPDGSASREATVALQVYKTRSRVQTSDDGHGPQARVRIAAEADVFEWRCREGPNPESAARVARAAAAEIRREAQLALKVIRDLGVDPVGFGNTLHRTNPQAWHGVEDRWPELLADLPITLDVRFKLRSYGMTNRAP